MDTTLQQRLEIFRSMETIPDAAVDFVAAELAGLESEYRIADDTAGMLTSHLVQALARMLSHTPDIEPPADEVYAQVVAEAPASVERATQISERAERTLGVPLSDIEQRYLAFHLATLELTAKEHS